MWRMVPDPVRSVADALRASGYEALVAGESALALLRREIPDAVELATSAPAATVLARFARAVPLRVPPAEPEAATIRVPTGSTVLDVACNPGADVEAILARHAFGVCAVGLDPIAQRVVDPHGGVADLAARRIATVGDARRIVATDPVRALRAARLAASLDARLAAELEAALPTVAKPLAGMPPVRLRGELERLLLARHAGTGIALLRRAGLERALLGEVAADAGPVTDALPRSLRLRWAAWLRGVSSAAVLARLRVPAELAQHVERVLALHPIDEHVGEGLGAVVRLVRRTPAEVLEDALALRRAELSARPERDVRAADALAGVSERIALARTRAAEPTLTISGHDVMTWLDRPPGPAIGRALRRLRAWVAEDPRRNEPERLRARLLEEARGDGTAERDPSGAHGLHDDRTSG